MARPRGALRKQILNPPGPVRQLLLRAFALCSLWSLGTACTPTILKARVERVRKAAIIGYEVGVDDTNEGLSIHASSDPARTTARAADVYARLGAKLSDQMHWQVLSEQEVATNAAYIQVYKKHSLGGFGRFAEAVGRGFLCPDILWGSLAYNLDLAEKRDLMKALGVDALVVAVVRLSPGSSSDLLGTVGWVSYDAATEFYTYDADGPDPIWKDPGAKGTSHDDAREVSAFGITLTTGEEKSFVQAIEDSYNTLVQRYREYAK